MLIHEKISAIMSEIGAIGKDQTNKSQGFKYRGIDDVMNALQPLLVKHGVFVVPEVTEHKKRRAQNQQRRQPLFNLHYEIHVFCDRWQFHNGRRRR